MLHTTTLPLSPALFGVTQASKLVSSNKICLHLKLITVQSSRLGCYIDYVLVVPLRY